MAALLDLADGGAKPTPVTVAERCRTMEARFGAGCRFLPDRMPKPLDTRVAPRERP